MLLVYLVYVRIGYWYRLIIGYWYRLVQVVGTGCDRLLAQIGTCLQ
jgi:hypothetical protein